ncbi:MAG: hypothetical protein LBT26_02115, partial [Clostridiales Family XIII bacterium]|nr:hypothetical protein [Clostridiales Family XIII bacterium]
METLHKEALRLYYNTALVKPTEEQNTRYLAYIEGAELSTVDDLPACSHTEKRHYSSLDDFLKEDDPPASPSMKEQNGEKVLRILDFVYRKGGYEAFSDVIADSVKYSHRGVKINEFFFEGSLLSAEQEIVYTLFQLNAQIHLDAIQAFGAQTQSLWETRPDVFAEIAANHPAPHVRLRAAAWLFPKDEEKYGRILNDLMPVLTAQAENIEEELFNACAFTRFGHERLNGKLREIWHGAPAAMAHVLYYNRHYYSEFLDETLFRKDYPHDD